MKVLEEETTGAKQWFRKNLAAVWSIRWWEGQSDQNDWRDSEEEM